MHHVYEQSGEGVEESFGENDGRGCESSDYRGDVSCRRARILRKHVGKVHEELERTADFTIYDSDDSKALIRDILVEKLGQTKKSAAPLPMKNFISAAKSSMKTSVNVNARTAMDSALRMKARGGSSNSDVDDDDEKIHRQSS